MTHDLENLLDRSVLSHLPAGFVRKFVLPKLKTQNLSAGAHVQRPESPSSVFIVLRGKVGLFIGEDHIGDVETGRALELAPVIERSKEWAYQWKAISASIVVHFPADVLLRAFDEDENLRSYLTRMTGHRSIQRFKHDLNLLGFSPELARSTITAFVHVSAAKLAAARARDRVILVDHGALEIQSKRGGDLYKSGDVVAVLQSDMPRIVPSGEGKCWVLERKKWESVASQELVANAFEVLLGNSEELGFVPTLQPAADKEEVEEEEAEEEESEESFDLGEFAANPKDRARLGRLNKLPFVAQHDTMDCGAACLAMVLEFYKKNITISRIRGVLNVSHDGASLADMVRAAGELGLTCDAIETSLEDMNDVRMPAIVLMEYHFVVVYKIEEDHVLVSDPAMGRLRMPRADFERDFSQLCLLMKPGPKFDSIPNDRKRFWKYSKLLRGQRLDLSRAGLAVIFLFLLNLIYPIFMQLIFDEVLIKNQLSALSVFLIGFTALSVARVFTEAVRDYLFLNFAAKFDLKVNSLFLRHAMALPFSYFAVRRTGDFLSRMDELEKIRDFISGKPIVLLINLLSIVVFGTALYLYNPVFLGIILFGIPIYAVVVVKVSGYLQPILDWKFKSGARAESKYLEAVTHLDTVRMQNSGISARWRWESEVIDGMAADRKYHYTAVVSDGLLELLEYTFSCTIMLTAAYLYSKGELSVGQVIAVSAMGTQLLGPVLDILKEWKSISEVAFSFSKIDDVFATRRENMRTMQGRHELKGHVELRDVTFRYGGDGSPTVLDSVSLEIRPGESIAFVGASGSGKSTLANMINMLYRPSEGSVEFDGQPGSAFELEFMRRQVAMIVQDNTIFTGTVLENIALGDTTPSLKRAIEAAKLADAHDFISKLGKGYLHPLTPNPELSGGERQRLCIARAFYLKPKILILDEATSALDSLSERKILKNLESFGPGMTKVTIAHRLNSVVNADRIIVMDHGRIVEEGSHRALLKRRGLYYHLFRKQLSA